MLYRNIIVVYSVNRTKHVNALCWQNVEFVNVAPDGTQKGLCRVNNEI
jgi:hypothetical protein